MVSKFVFCFVENEITRVQSNWLFLNLVTYKIKYILVCGGRTFV